MAGPTNGGAPLSVRLLDLGAVDPYVAQTFVEALAPFVAAQESPPTLLIASPRDTYVSLGFHQSYEVSWMDRPSNERA